MPPPGAMSHTGGVKPMDIGGRLVRERERLQGMTNEERAWRKQYLKDQVLSHTEPRYVPEYWQQRLNPLRRFYRYPLDRFGEWLVPRIGKPKAEYIRYMAGKVPIVIALVYMTRYYFKYNGNDWTRRGGWAVMESRSSVYPGDPGFPKLSDKSKPSDYADKGFSKSPI